MYLAELPARIAGIPCLIGVKQCLVVPGDPATWDSDWDYHGYDDIDYDVLDRRGRSAPWLQRKVDSAIDADINRQILTWSKAA